ncbi:SgcJ/EcaC family oxidoreductase [Rhodoferax ferrireducens]|uniref:SgcJ/EcaC family oxidoreductase n=1 Tax=Rhodoferax ferrireducens TaxID=192843 RepID=UPI00298E64E5|nr:SgcJ/EcaC family oxidoreductase [Rhodoferax ferrireducens]WPC67356.1 SgcJ/EcaC family oxidoreductase [Rhodoferax ferrireducens]
MPVAASRGLKAWIWPRPPESTAWVAEFVVLGRIFFNVASSTAGGSRMSADSAAVTRIVEAFAECWNRHDMNAFAELFAPDAEFVNVVGLWWKGRAEIKAAHEFTHQTLFKNSRLTLVELSTRFPTPQIAIVRCRWRLVGHVTPQGIPLPERQGVLLNVLRQQDGKWFIIDSQNTDIIEGVASRPQ